MSGRQRQRYSEDLKRRVVYQREVLGFSTTEISKNLGMSLRVVQRTLHLWEEINSVVRDPQTYAKQERAQLLDTAGVEFLLGLLDRHPDIYLDEISTQFLEQRDMVVSLSTIQRTLKLLGFESKKLSRAAAELYEESRNRFLFAISKESPERLVFTDESSVNMLTTYRSMGHAYRGQRARVQSYFERGDRYSILPALTLDGIIYAHVLPGSFNGATFKIFLTGLLEFCMNPYPGPNSVLVMNNCAIHDVEGVQELCDSKGVKLMYLPPYSPDFNPIEECFSFIKHDIHHHGSEFRELVECGAKDKIYGFLYDSMSMVTSDKAKVWFHHLNYV